MTSFDAPTCADISSDEVLGSQATMARSDRVLFENYARTPVVFVRGAGSWLYDAAGKRYLDCLTGLAVVAVGHANARVAQAVSAQMTTLGHVSNLFYSVPQVDLAEELIALSGLDRVFFANCGATANESAIKLARRYMQEKKGADAFEIISLDHSFHGRTLATLAATGQPAKHAPFRPLPPGFRHIPAEDLDRLAGAIGAQTAAVIVESVQGEGGVNVLSKAYLQGVRALCDQNEVLLIADDIQAGVGRCGSWFSWQDFGFMPDIATVAKALANGLPIGACLARSAVAKAFRPGDHGTTFGGGPVVCRAALAVIEEIKTCGLLENCRQRSAQLKAGLLGLPGVIGIRGRGLLLAAELEGDRARDLTDRALDHGLVVNAVRPNAIRLAPPLSLSESEADEAIARLQRAICAS